MIVKYTMDSAGSELGMVRLLQINIVVWLIVSNSIFIYTGIRIQCIEIKIYIYLTTVLQLKRSLHAI
jgi:hypothetical protein